MLHNEALTGRTCTKCRKHKPVAHFYKRGDSPQGRVKLRSKCIQCLFGQTAQRGRRRRPNAGLPGASWKTQHEKKLFYNYGLTLDAYDTMLSGQGGVCAICKRPEVVPNQKLSVDHDHSTGKIRGILCSLCNQALGMLSDSPELFMVAAEYLRTR